MMHRSVLARSRPNREDYSRRNDVKKKSTYDITKKAASLIANEGVKNYQNGSDVSIEGMRLFYQAAKNTENVDFAQRKGNLFEYIEASKFNYKAAIARVETRAVVTAADGRPHDPSDIDLVRNEKIIRRVQAKFMNTRDVQGRDTSAASSVLAQAGGQGKNGGHWGKYDGMQRLIRKGDSYQTDPVTGKPVSILDESV